MENELKKRNIEILRTIACKNTYDSIKYHPDICVFNLGNGNIIVEPSVYKEYKEILEIHNFNVIKGESEVKSRYPHNIVYNVAIVGEYAKCSICIIDEESIITSDKGIYASLKETGIDCLLIEGGL